VTRFLHRTMGSKTEFDTVAAELLWRMKATAAKEVQAVHGEKSPNSKICEPTKTRVAHPSPTTSFPCQTKHSSILSKVVHVIPRSRTISVGSFGDMPLPSNALSSLAVLDPSLTSKGLSPLRTHQRCFMLDHFDWTDRSTLHDHRASASSSSSLISVSEVSSSSTDKTARLPMKKEQVSSTVMPKVPSFVGQAANVSGERGVLRKKFSWRQFPEVRSFP
jgi:hypothetical protein